MATKPRHKKTDTQLWVYDNAKRLGLTDQDLARATGVEPGTARSWFSRGKPNADAVPILERLFGRPAPQEEAGPSALGEAGTAALVGLVTTMLEELRAERQARVEWEQGFLEAMRELARGAARQGDLAPAPPAVVRP